MADSLVAWRGELLWPQDLPAGDIIDLTCVTALGTWTYAWFRARPNQAVTGGTPALKRQLLAAGVPILWCDTSRVAAAGVGRDERAALLDDPVALTDLQLTLDALSQPGGYPSSGRAGDTQITDK